MSESLNTYSLKIEEERETVKKCIHNVLVDESRQ